MVGALLLWTFTLGREAALEHLRCRIALRLRASGWR